LARWLRQDCRSGDRTLRPAWAGPHRTRTSLRRAERRNSSRIFRYLACRMRGKPSRRLAPAGKKPCD